MFNDYSDILTVNNLRKMPLIGKDTRRAAIVFVMENSRIKVSH